MKFDRLLLMYLTPPEDKDAPAPSTLTCYDGQNPSGEKIKTWCQKRNGKGSCPFLVTRKKAKKLHEFFKEHPEARYVQEYQIIED